MMAPTVWVVVRWPLNQPEEESARPPEPVGVAASLELAVELAQDDARNAHYYKADELGDLKDTVVSPGEFSDEWDMAATWLVPQPGRKRDKTFPHRWTFYGKPLQGKVDQ